MSSTEGRLPPKFIFHWRLSSIEGRLPKKVVFNRRTFSTKGCLVWGWWGSLQSQTCKLLLCKVDSSLLWAQNNFVCKNICECKKFDPQIFDVNNFQSQNFGSWSFTQWTNLKESMENLFSRSLKNCQFQASNEVARLWATSPSVG